MDGLRKHGEDSSKAFATPALERVGGQHHALAALPYPPEGSDTHCTWGWVGIGAGMDRHGKSRPRRA